MIPGALNAYSSGLSRKSLKAYFSFEPKTLSGTTLYDQSGQGNNGTLQNSPTLVTGTVGKGMQFVSASSQRVSVANSNGFINGSTAYSVSAIYKRTTSGSIIVAACRTGNNGMFTGYYSDGNCYVTAATTTNSFGFFSSAGTSTKFLVTKFDGSQSTNATRMKAFENGVQISLSFNLTIPTSISTTATLLLGYDGQNSAYSNGIIDEYRYYTRVTTALEDAYFARGGT